MMRACPVGDVERLPLLRKLIIFGAFVVLLVAGLSTAVLSYRERTTVQRGWRDAAAGSNLPQHGPIAGINVDLTQYTPDEAREQVRQIVGYGFAWVRQTIRWSAVETARGVFDWSRYDALFDILKSTPALRVIAVIDESPEWARAPGAEGSRYAPPASPADFGAFAGQVAARYAGQIAAYQLWDEPNLAAHWGGLDVRPAEYAAMLRAAYPLIKATDPDAPVIAAGLAPTVEAGPRNLSDVAYLDALYANSAREVMDAVSGKPYGFDRSPDDRTVNPAVLNFSRLILLREVMEQHGDGEKPIFASHFGWNHLPEGWTAAPSIWGQVSADQQRDYTMRAYARASQEWPWLSALILESWEPNAPKDDPVQGFAVRNRIADWKLTFADGLTANGLYTATHPAIRYTGEWRFGPLGADVGQNSDKSDSSFSAPFTGSSVALRVRRDDYVAYLYITVDGQPANALPTDGSGRTFILLTSTDRQPRTETILVAQNLAPGPHTLAVRAYLGYGRWAIAGIAIGAAPPGEQTPLIAGGAFLTVIALVGLVWSGRTLSWARLANPAGGVAAYLRRMADVLLGIAVAAAAALGMLLTFGGALPNLFRRDEPAVILTILTAGLAYFSPGFLINAAAVILLFLLIYNKPSLGLCLVAFFAPFFLYPVQNYLRALPMVELCLILTVVAVALRGLLALPGRVRATSGRQEWRPYIQIYAIDYLLVIFIALAVLSLLWSEQRAPAIRELRIMVIEPILFYALVRAIKPERGDMLRLVDSLLLGAVAVAAAGIIYQIATGSRGPLTSVYGSRNNLALYLGRALPFALAMCLFPLGRLRRGAAFAVLCLLLLSVLLTQSAGALILGIPAGLAVTLLAWNPRRGLLVVPLGVVLLGVALVVLLPRLQASNGGSLESWLTRGNVWTSALNLLRERPITGAGLDQFLYLYRSRYILPDAYKEPDLSHPHNVVLDFWVSLGLAGLLLFFVLQAAFWTTLFRARNRLRGDVFALALCAGAMGAMADFLAHGLVDNSYFVVDLAYAFCLLLALAAWLSTMHVADSVRE